MLKIWQFSLYQMRFNCQVCEHSEKENQHERVSGRKLSSRPQTSVYWQVEVWLEVLEVAENVKQNLKKH